MTRGVMSSTTRTGRIERWLSQHKHLEKSTTLRLEVEHDENRTSVVSVWERSGDDWSDAAVAAEADAAGQGIADESGSKVEASLAWVTPSGETWRAYPLTFHPAGGASNLDGSHKSQATQAQQHAQVLMRLDIERQQITHQENRDQREALYKMMELTQAMLQASMQRSEQLHEEFQALRQENAELRIQAMEAEEGAQRAAEVAEEATNTVVEMKKQKDDDASVVNMFGKALMAHNEQRGKKESKGGAGGAAPPTQAAQ